MKNRFKNWKAPKFKKNGMTEWYWVCQHHKNLKIGKCVDIGTFSYLNAKYGIELQDDVQIGSHCSLYTLSTIDGKKGRIVIKKNARLGTHSTVMPGVTIGRNSVIGAYSFVNRNVSANCLAFGIPVKVIRKLMKT